MTFMQFQSTLPLRGATCATKRFKPKSSTFQSTLPLRGATDDNEQVQAAHHISIHTPLAGSDTFTHVGWREPYNYFNPHSPCGERPDWTFFRCMNSGDFNPHSPCGERLQSTPSAVISSLFQSTLPLRGATFSHDIINTPYQISIHTPLAGSDRRNETFLTK